jgi:multicomponent K+:H+ antiporter subunit A
MSIIAVVGGLVVLAAHGPLLRVWDAVPRPEAKRIFDAIVRGAVGLARGITDGLHNGAFTRYAAVFAATVASPRRGPRLGDRDGRARTRVARGGSGCRSRAG